MKTTQETRTITLPIHVWKQIDEAVGRITAEHMIGSITPVKVPRKTPPVQMDPMDKLEREGRRVFAAEGFRPQKYNDLVCLSMSVLDIARATAKRRIAQWRLKEVIVNWPHPHSPTLSLGPDIPLSIAR